MNYFFKSTCENNKRERSPTAGDSPSPISKLRRQDNEMEELLAEMKTIKEEIRNSEGRITSALEAKIEPLVELQPAIRNLQDKVDIMERSVKHFESEDTRKNLIVFGYPEKQQEGWRDLCGIVDDLSKKLKCSRNIDFDNAYRIGKKVNGRRRPILVKLLRTMDKYYILGLTRNLRGTSITVDEDFSPKERIVKKLAEESFRA